MSVAILSAIILVCQVTGASGNSYTYAREQQIYCQKALIKCVKSKKGNPEINVVSCIEER